VRAEPRVALLLGIGMLTFASAPLLVRAAGPDADPLALALVRTACAALVMAPVWWRHPAGRLSNPPPSSGSGWGGLNALAGLFLALHFVLWVAALGHTSVASASVLVTCHPVLLIVIEAFALRRSFARATWVGVAIAFCGTAFLAWADRAPAATYDDPLLGNLLAFAAAVMFAGYLLASERLRRRQTWLDTVARVYLAAAVLTGLFFVLSGGTREAFTGPVIAAGVALAFGAQLIGHGALNYAVRFFSPTLLATLVLVEPVLATVLAYALFAEAPAPIALVGLGLTLAGILLSWWGRRSVLEFSPPTTPPAVPRRSSPPRTGS
jgi:drug/metabolite transporter (DMT)-like permease